ncbi:hypothetical protein MN0502_34600 (plasmid) [Arthrobacter sp. MN05-02]|nr:hypothetical protein MN0502_34600 [Arthrobacter sp. MN05-02]
MTVEALASILWVRSPAAASDVPRQVLLASAYAGMQPSLHLWSRYLEEVEKLENSSAVTADEAIILRSSSVSRETLMDETLGDPEALTAESPKEVLNRIKSEATAPLESQVEILTQRTSEISQVADHASEDWLVQVKAREKAEKQVLELENEKTSLETSVQTLKNLDQARRTSIANHAQELAKKQRKRIAFVGRIVCIAVVLAALGYFLSLPDPAGKTGATIVGACAFLSIVISFLPKNMNVLNRLEEHRSGRLKRDLLRNAGFE